ncbi:MAG: hypothetical protein HPY57_13090 [Ignavibacteria bacterium]|nr:hypothetical protein [Ignavibacteria bacterium]
MTCKLCNKLAVKDGLCRIHFIEYKESIFLDNTSCDRNMGILQWLKYMYPEHYRHEFNSGHIQVLLMLLRLYDPRYINKQHRLRELIAFRGFAKSKLIFGLVSYLLAHNGQIMKIKAEDGKVFDVKINEKYIVIFSETATMAEDFVVNIRDEFIINPMLKYFYKLTIEEAVDDTTGQWTKKAFKINNCFIAGFGAKQQARGRIKGAYRPTFAFFDDIYSENNTITAESRLSIKKWFYNSAINSVDDLLGKVFLVGTIVHEDTVLVECERSDTWKTLKFYPMDLLDFQKVVTEHVAVNTDMRIAKLPFDDEKDEFVKIEKQRNFFKSLENKYKVLWSDRVGLYELVLKYKEAIENQNIAGFYQEYFHEVVPQELKRFNREYFQRLEDYEIKYEYGYYWLIEKDKRPMIMNIEIGVDIAGGKLEGDNTAITVVGILPDERILVLEQVYGKMSIRDRNTQKGYIDELYRLAVKYKPLRIKIGFGGGHEGAIIEETRRVFISKGLYTTIVARPQNRSEGEKFERIERTLLPFYEAYRVYHLCDTRQLEYELEFLRKAKNDDCTDSLEVALWNVIYPPNIDINFFKSNSNKRFDYYTPKVEDWIVI